MILYWMLKVTISLGFVFAGFLMTVRLVRVHGENATRNFDNLLGFMFQAFLIAGGMSLAAFMALVI